MFPARSHSPLCACSEPQQGWPAGVINFATIPRQHFDRVAVHIAENQVLGATGQHRHAIASLCLSRGVIGLNQFVGKLRLH